MGWVTITNVDTGKTEFLGDDVEKANKYFGNDKKFYTDDHGEDQQAHSGPPVTKKQLNQLSEIFNEKVKDWKWEPK